MSNKRSFTVEDAPKPAGPYSHGVVAHGLLFTAGVGPQNPATGEIDGDDAYAQTRRVLTTISNILRDAGVGLDAVVKVTAHLAHLDRDFAEFNRAYGEFFTEDFPVRTTVGSTLSGILVEIDVVASLPEA